MKSDEEGCRCGSHIKMELKWLIFKNLRVLYDIYAYIVYHFLESYCFFGKLQSMQKMPRIIHDDFR